LVASVSTGELVLCFCRRGEFERLRVIELA
jgi:hypothetical protein